jgi:hypothetical protein
VVEQTDGKTKQDRVMMAIVGSYPKPVEILHGSGQELLDAMGMTFYELEKEIGAREFKNRLDQAALMAIQEQNREKLTTMAAATAILNSA